jgi:hypothetical protein
VVSWVRGIGRRWVGNHEFCRRAEDVSFWPRRRRKEKEGRRRTTLVRRRGHAGCIAAPDSSAPPRPGSGATPQLGHGRSEARSTNSTRKKRMMTVGVHSSLRKEGNDIWGPLLSVSKKPRFFHQTTFNFLTAHSPQQLFFTATAQPNTSFVGPRFCLGSQICASNPSY